MREIFLYKVSTLTTLYNLYIKLFIYILNDGREYNFSLYMLIFIDSFLYDFSLYNLEMQKND